jgi:hypothetical protein
MKKARVKLKSLVLVASVAVIGLAGCKPKTISGQVFISSESGLGLPINNVQIRLVDGKEAEGFLRNKAERVKADAAAIQKDMARLQTEQEAAEQNALKVKAASDQYIENQSWTNDPKCIQLMEESEKGAKTAEALANSQQSMISKYGPPGGFNNPIPRAGQLGNNSIPSTGPSSPDQKAAWAAIKQDQQKIKELVYRSQQIDREYKEIMDKLIREKQRETSDAQQSVEAIKTKQGITARSLADLHTAFHYLSDFNPTPVETTLTDETGNFAIKAPRQNAKIFAKIKLDELGINYFWLVDLPQKGEKLILSNNNQFTVPTNFP